MGTQFDEDGGDLKLTFMKCGNMDKINGIQEISTVFNCYVEID